VRRVQSGGAAGGAVELAADGIRELIFRRRLSPGQQIRQEELATLFGISRSPVREALQSLESEGLVLHEPNRGYFVNGLSADELRQTYLMRRLLETEVLRSIAWPRPAKTVELRKLNARIEHAGKRETLDELVRLNRTFHFDIFSLAPLDVVVAEINRLWLMSEQYRAVYLWDERARERIVQEHEEMIAAIEVQDAAQLVATADKHRQAAERRVLALLAEES
jgi:DNA-binding GntR family transcriptional regulator